MRNQHWRREGEETTQPFTGTTVALPEGSYTILGHATDYEDAKTTARVVAGRESAAVLIFKKIVKNTKAGEPIKGARPRGTEGCADL